MNCEVPKGPELLKFLRPQTALFENLLSDNSNTVEIRFPFSTPVYNIETENKINVKKRFGKDLYTAFCFSPEFKTVIKDVKQQMFDVNKSNYVETNVVVEGECEANKTESKLLCLEKIIRNKLELLNFPSIDSEKKETANEKDGREKNESERSMSSKKFKPWQTYETYWDTMSSYWRLLTYSDTFRISPPYYDAYAEGKNHWLQSKPVPPEVLKNAEDKCLLWLKKYHKN